VSDQSEPPVLLGLEDIEASLLVIPENLHKPQASPLILHVVVCFAPIITFLPLIVYNSYTGDFLLQDPETLSPKELA
jgi:hypothetical protein